MRSFAFALTFAFTLTFATAEEPDHELVRGAAPSLRVGQRGTLSLSLVPRGGTSLYADGPVLVRVVGTRLRPARTLYQRDEAVDPRADVPRFELQVTATEKGPATLTAHCTFYLCKAARCRPVESEATWSFEVAP